MTNHFRQTLKRVTKMLISVVFLAGGVIWTGGRRLLGKKTPPIWTTIYYHSIAPERRSHFARQMDLLVKFTTPLRVSDCRSRTTEAKCYSSVTFDDAFETILDNALPE